MNKKGFAAPINKAFIKRKNMKNLLLFSTILLTSAGAFAQLTVQPTAAGADSYVYVSDQILYVKEAINLSRNTSLSTTTEASIYLRKDAQLIQGNPLAKNSGNGQLSVQQNTMPTNAFAYYYWCSPIGNPVDVAGTTTYAPGNTNFGLGTIYEDTNPTTPVNLKGIGTEAIKSVNIPGKEGFSSPLTISRRWMYIMPLPGTEKEGNYIRINATNGAPAGYGFTMKGVNEGGAGSLGNTTLDQTYEFRGRPNNGDFDITVDGPLGALPNVDAKMTLSGNPYPSALDLNKLFFEPGNEALGAIYYYDEDRSKMTHLYSGKPFGYGCWIPGDQDPYTSGVPNPTLYPGTYTKAPFYIWNAGGGSTSTTGLSGNDPNKRFAPIGQGFMLVGKNAGTVTIKNAHRIFVKEGAASHSVFQRPDGGDETADENNINSTLSTSSSWSNSDRRTPQMRLYAIFDEAMTRDMVLLFSDQATDGYDRGLDGLSTTGLAADAYFPVGNDNERLPYVINTVNYDVNKQIPFAFKLNKSTNITLRVIEEVKKPYAHAYLFDSQENTYKELTNANIAGVSLTLPAGTFDNRFFIVFRNPNVKRDIPENEVESKQAIVASVDFFQNNPMHQLEISNPEGYTIKAASVYDMSGKLVINEKNLGANNKYSFYTGNLSDGVYLVKLTTSEDVSIDYKTIVHNQ